MENETAERKSKIEPENMTFYKLCDDVVRLHRKNSATSIILISVYVFMIFIMFNLGRRISKLEDERDVRILPEPTDQRVYASDKTRKLTAYVKWHDVRILPEPTDQRVYASDKTRKLTAYVKWHDGGMQRFSLKSYRKIGCGMLELETNNSIEQDVKIIAATENTIILERSKKNENQPEGLIDNRTDGSR